MVMVPKALWETYDVPDQAVAVATWVDRDIAVVFPITWAHKNGEAQMIRRAKERIAEIEVKSNGKFLEKGSVLLAFSDHEDQPSTQLIIPEISRRLI